MFQNFISVLIAPALLCSPSFGQNEDLSTLEVTVRPYGDNAQAVVNFDGLFMELESGKKISFGEWMRRALKSSDEVISGKLATELYGTEHFVYDRTQLNTAHIGTLISARHKGRDFINIAQDFNFDPGSTNSAWYHSPFFEYAPPPVSNLIPADQELGVLFPKNKWQITDVYHSKD